jgi:septal ring factor EnvC (AmiA/AmiB activator)
VTYAQIERAATDILKTGVRPTLEGVRSAVGGGSPRTILDGLNRYWRDLGNQAAGTPDTLRRLPAAVADLAEGLWQRALSLATDAAQASSADGDAQLSRLKSQLELRAHTLSQREVELDELLRARERTVKEPEEHLRAAISTLSNRDATIVAVESRLAAAQQETEGYRQRLAKVVWVTQSVRWVAELSILTPPRRAQGACRNSCLRAGRLGQPAHFRAPQECPLGI